MKQRLRKVSLERRAITVPSDGAMQSPKTLKAVLPVLLLAALLLLVAPLTHAAPANDDINNATGITALPYDDGPIDTTSATTEADDPDCVGNGPTVWYVFTPTEDLTILANTFGSNYDTTLSVYTGSPGALTQIDCNDDFDSLQSRVIFNATAGTTYYFMVGSFASGSGGSLFFHAEVAPPRPEIDVSINPRGTVKASTGIAIVSGTMTCNVPANGWLDGTLRQKVGRRIISAYFGRQITCDPPATSWSVTVSSSEGAFAGGKATVLDVNAHACNEVDCDFVHIPGPLTVQLRGSSR